jgi:anti-sigma regulatory factor (Ser/Thr protein kinase)
MPDRVNRLSVFVASPSDTTDERDRLGHVIAELNRGVAAAANIVLSLIRWETHVRPGIGTDPQAVVNRQVPVGDVLVALFWKRLGTPTPRALSGSVEELEKAINRWHKSQDIEILVYFNQQPYTPTARDLEQVTRLLAFREQVERMGILVCEYDGPADFEAKVREHLTAVVNSRAEGQRRPAVSSAPTFARRPHRWLDDHDVLSVEVPVRRSGVNELIASDLNVHLAKRSFSSNLIERATTIVLELLANVAMHSDAAVAQVTVEMHSLSMSSLALTVQSDSEPFDLTAALATGRRAYEMGDHEHGLVKVERLASFIDTAPPAGEDRYWPGIECRLFERRPENSGVFHDFPIVTSVYYEHDGIPAWRIGGAEYCGSNASDALAFALEEPAPRLFDLYFGAGIRHLPRFVGIEIAGRAHPTARLRDQLPRIAPKLRGVRSRDTMPAAIEAWFHQQFEKGHVVFHGFDLGLDTEHMFAHWTHLWDLPHFADIQELRQYLNALQI